MLLHCYNGLVTIPFSACSLHDVSTSANINSTPWGLLKSFPILSEPSPTQYRIEPRSPAPASLFSTVFFSFLEATPGNPRMCQASLEFQTLNTGVPLSRMHFSTEILTYPSTCSPSGIPPRELFSPHLSFYHPPEADAICQGALLGP